jgi:hypothetical protein
LNDPGTLGDAGNEKRLNWSRNLLAYLLTPWSRVLLEKLIGSKLVKKFPAFYGTRRFITAFTTARHLSLTSARSIQTIHPPTPLPVNPFF